MREKCKFIIEAVALEGTLESPNERCDIKIMNPLHIKDIHPNLVLSSARNRLFYNHSPTRSHNLITI
jgi:hypothetical protein